MSKPAGESRNQTRMARIGRDGPPGPSPPALPHSWRAVRKFRWPKTGKRQRGHRSAMSLSNHCHVARYDVPPLFLPCIGTAASFIETGGQFYPGKNRRTALFRHKIISGRRRITLSCAKTIVSCDGTTLFCWQHFVPSPNNRVWW